MMHFRRARTWQDYSDRVIVEHNRDGVLQYNLFGMHQTPFSLTSPADKFSSEEYEQHGHHWSRVGGSAC